MFAIWQKELDKAPDLIDMVKCHKCGKEHPVQTSAALAFFKCTATKKSYLCGYLGKQINHKTEEKR